MSENGGRLLPGRVNRENDDSPVGQLPISQSLAFPMLDAFLQFWPSIFSLSLKAITQHLWIAAPMVVIYHIIFIIYVYIYIYSYIYIYTFIYIYIVNELISTGPFTGRFLPKPISMPGPAMPDIR